VPCGLGSVLINLGLIGTMVARAAEMIGVGKVACQCRPVDQKLGPVRRFLLEEAGSNAPIWIKSMFGDVIFL
jgi:hypothetical protein